MQSMSETPYLGELEHLLLLAILQCGDDAYTVPIREVLAERSRRRITRGALYTSLDRLEAKGLVVVAARRTARRHGGRSRRYFAVTATGVEALRAARLAVANLSQGLDAVLGGPR